MVKILVVDDSRDIRQLMRIHLQRAGYEVLEAKDGEDAMEVLDHQSVALILLDIMMPNMDGYEFTRELREAGNTLPILMVTAKDTFPAKKQGFSTGADDYMTKPVDMDEMLLRVSALLRRAQIHSEKQIVMGETKLLYDRLEAVCEGKRIELTKKEFYLLYQLASYPKKIFTRIQLMDQIWGYDNETDERTIDVHIKRIREKFEGSGDFQIITVRGLGYKLVRGQ